MALYSVHIGEVQRSKGQNAVASAAYNSRSKLSYSFTSKENNIPGEITWNYSDKEGLAYSKIIAPSDAPDWVYDREELWNRAEEAELRIDSQTARKFMVALQKELSEEQNIDLINDIAKELVSLGMVVDINVHNDNPDNPHAHLQATLRELVENRNGEIEFSKIKNREWGSRAFYCSFREMVADKINEHFMKAGIDKRVTHESYKTLGIDLEPSKHEGPSRNIKNAELVKNNLLILEENYKKILEDPARILDKLTINNPVFTKDQIAIELEKILSHGFDENGNSEEMEKEISSKYMSLHASIMNSPELALVIDSDLRGRRLYTTQKRLEMEERYLGAVRELYASKGHSLDITITDKDLQKAKLSDEKLSAAMNILNGKDIEVLEGIPGSGKTVLMKELVAAYKRAGKKVIGAAPSSAAALVLQKATGIEAKNASLWRKDWQEGAGEKFDLVLKGDYYKEEEYKSLPHQGGTKQPSTTSKLKKLFKGDPTKTMLTKDHVLIIDEASMMELSNMDYMINMAKKAGSKVILVGDNNQLHGVGWLGAFKKTIDICGSSRLDESRRQRNPEHSRATELLGQYRVREALDIYLKDKSIIIEKGELKAKARLISEYVDKYLESAKSLERDDIASMRSQVISTYTNYGVSALNREVRERLKSAGVIKGRGHKVNVGDKMIELSRGEQIVFTRNFNHLGSSGIFNGEIGTILSVSKPDKIGDTLITVSVAKGDGTREKVIIDTKKHSKFGDRRLLDYGYAVTSHKLQGASVDSNFLYFEKNMGYEAMNVLLTRHRNHLRCFVNSEALEEIAYESLSSKEHKRDPDLVRAKFDINDPNMILNALVKQASRRINSSFASDYKDLGLKPQDKHIMSYMDKVHESMELIKEAANWQTAKQRENGSKPEIWHHPNWDQVVKARDERQAAAKEIVDNLDDHYCDRISQMGLNYQTIENHANNSKVRIQERDSVFHKNEHYINFVKAIDNLDYTLSKHYYSKLKSDVVENQLLLKDAIKEKTYLEEKHDELTFAIEGEKNFREKLMPNYLSRIYKDEPEVVLENFKTLTKETGDEKAINQISKKPQILGSLKGVGIGKFVGIGKKREDAIANIETLEKQLLAYSRSEKIESEYHKELSSKGISIELIRVKDKIEETTKQLPSSLDGKLLDKFHADVICHTGQRGNSNAKAEEKKGEKTKIENKVEALDKFTKTELYKSIRKGAIKDKQIVLFGEKIEKILQDHLVIASHQNLVNERMQRQLVIQTKQSIEYALTHNLLSHDEALKHLSASVRGNNPGSIREASKQITKICYDHNVKTIQHDLKQLNDDRMVKHGGKWFEKPYEYLTHWKENHHHHMIPIKQINNDLKELESHHAKSMEHDKGMEV